MVYIIKPFDTVHHPDQSEDSQDEDNVQDLTAGVIPRYNQTGKSTGHVYKHTVMLRTHCLMKRTTSNCIKMF